MAHARALPRFLSELNKLPIDLILDLEDSVGNCADSNITIAAKKRARDKTQKIYQAVAEQLRLGLHIRINASDSMFFRQDLEMVNGLLSKHEGSISIFLPKTRGESCISNFFNEIDQKFHDRVTLHPIVETKDGIEQFPAILEALPMSTHAISVGLLDLQFSMNQFPLLEPGSPELLEHLRPIRERLRETSIRLTLGPILELNKTLIQKTFLQWESFFGYLPDLHSLSSAQTHAFASKGSRNTFENLIFPSDPHELAHALISAYEGQSRLGKNLVFYRQTRYISPHEYLLAKRFLQES